LHIVQNIIAYTFFDYYYLGVKNTNNNLLGEFKNEKIVN
jgi:hypothetical protein